MHRPKLDLAAAVFSLMACVPTGLVISDPGCDEPRRGKPWYEGKSRGRQGTYTPPKARNRKRRRP